MQSVKALKKENAPKSSAWRNMTKALEDEREGLKQVAQEIRSAEALQGIDKVTKRILQGDYEHDTEGDDFDLDRVLLRLPECWVKRREDTTIQRGRGNIVRVVFNFGVSGFCGSEVIKQKGREVYKLVSILKAQGYCVGVTLALGATWGGNNLEIYIPIKAPGEVSNLPRLAFQLCSPFVLRCFYFAVLDGIPDLSKKLSGNGGGYGKPCEVAEGGDVYISQSQACEDGWLEKMLKGAGLNLKKRRA